MRKKSESKARKSSQRQTTTIKTRNKGEWTEARFRSFITGALRSASRRWKPISRCKSEARVSRGKYRCASCGGHFGTKEIVIDHIAPVVPLSGWVSYDDFVDKLFCESSNLQALCKSCHKDKTAEEAKLRGMSRKIKGGSLLDIIKLNT